MGLRESIVHLLGYETATAERVQVESVGIDKDEYTYRQIGGSYVGVGRQVPPQEIKRAIELARYVFDTDPLAHGIVETSTDFVVGEGFEVTVEPILKGEQLDDDERKKVRLEAQAIVDRHWNSRVNNWPLNQRNRVRDLAIDGESFYTVIENEANGEVEIGYLDTLLVRGVYFRPENMTEAIMIEVARNNSTDTDFYRVVHEDRRPESPTRGRLIGIEDDEAITIRLANGHKKTISSFKGAVFSFSINRHTAVSRGRSDLLPILDWLNAYGRMMYTFFDRIELMLSFVWDVKLLGADEVKVEEWKKKHPKPPKPGSLRVHADSEEWSAIAPTLRFEDNKIGTGMMKNQILAATGLPPFWFAESSEATRATALEMGTPAFKRLMSRQLEVMHFMRVIFDYVIDRAIIMKDLDDKYDYKIIIQPSEMSSRDLTRAGASFLSVVSSLEGAIQNGIIDRFSAQEILAMMALSLGVKIDLEMMRERIKKDPPPSPEEVTRTRTGALPERKELGDPGQGKT